VNDDKIDIPELMRTNKRFQTFMEESIEPIWCFELDKPLPIDLPEDEQFDLFYNDTYLKENNRAYAQVFGYERKEDLLGKRFSEIIPPSIPENTATIKQVIRAGYNLRNFVTVGFYKEKKFIILNNVYGVIEDGQLLRVWGTSRDITAQKVAEDKFRKAKLYYRTIADFTYDWETWENPDCSYNYVSPSFERVAGYSPQQLVNRPELLNEMILPDDLTSWLEHHQVTHVQNETGEIQFRIRAKNGQIRWIEHKCQSVYNDQGEYLGVRASNRDITKRKMAEEELIESTERFQLSFKIANIAICLVSPEGRFVMVNNQMCKMFGYSKEELEAMSTEDFAHPEDLGISPKYIQQAISGSVDHQRFVKRYVHKDGHIVWGEVSSTIVRNDAGNPQYFISYLLDITERKQAEIELRNAFKEIEQLKTRLHAESAYLQDEIKSEHNFENIIGNSSALQYVLYRVAEVALTDAPVLIMGETGTGKELIARAIHNASPRSKRPLVKVNCAALPASLIESELFGHEKGAFTGADVRRIGRFQLADGATLFLDEISEIPLELQAKLLQVLQDGEFELLGSSKTIRTDVRIIAASNRNLKDEVNHGRFRQDLFYRINVFPLTIPPLRNRKEDIPILVNWFIDRYNRKMGKNITSIPAALIKHLHAYDWPGNVRELENVIERAVITSKDSILKLTERLATSANKKTRAKSSKTLAEMEREHILNTLENTDWKIEGKNGAADVLGLAPSTLRGRMKKLEIYRSMKQ
jgi:formate hydrogenlyase transcriptional activator